MTLEIIATEAATAEHIAAEPLVEEPGRGKRLTRRALLARRFFRNKTAVIGLVMYGLLAILAIIGPIWISRWGYTEIDREPGNYLASPSTRHWFGTTQAGRDVFSMSLQGLRKSMLIGLVTGVLSTTIAATVGSFAAYFGKWVDRGAMWVVDLLLVMPAFLFLAIMTSTLGAGNDTIFFLIILLAAFSWMLSARVVRSLSLSVRDREYVTAAKYMGVPGPTIVFRHILPNIASLLIIDATIGIAGAVLAETGLSFFGFGIRSPDTSLGTLISDGSRMATTFPWVFYAGAGFLVIMILSINFIGDGLRDAFDPSSQSGGKA